MTVRAGRPAGGSIGRANGARALVACLSVLVLPGCRRSDSRDESWLILVPASPMPRTGVVRTVPAGLLRGAAREGERLVLTLAAAADRPLPPGACVIVDGACSVAITREDLAPGARRERALVPLIDVGPPRPQLGFDTTFTVEARAGCDEARQGRVTWRQLSGAPLGALRAGPGNFSVTARTPRRQDLLADADVPWGLVPVSPRTRGQAVLEAEWRSGRGDADTQVVRRTITVAAASRASGLPNVPMGARMLLGGLGWHVVERPPGSLGQVRSGEAADGGLASFLPDVAGVFRLQDAAGRALLVQAGRLDQTPLDCGRAGCHPSIVDAAAASPMTTSLTRLLGPAARSAAELPTAPGCTLGCHAPAEDGLADGGFTAAASDLGLNPEHLTAPWDELPRPLRRLGGVGCLACHGPAAVPEPAARWSILRSDVCAVCHDAPPRYGHVVAWRQARMARADADPRTRAEPACARCHTTWGFLASLAPSAAEGGTAASTPARRPPEEITGAGITCAACHAVHEPDPVAHAGLASGGRTVGPRRALLRSTPVPAALESLAVPTGRAGTVCLACHTPDPAATFPSASAAALLFGRGGVDPLTGATWTGPAPHGAVPGGCVGCHRAGPSGVERGAGHAFAVDPRACRACHVTDRPVSDVRARAERLWSALRPRGPQATGPAHAHPPALERSTALGRAAWNAALVLEDPAAGVHNGAYARALLDSAARVAAEAGR